MNCLTHTDTPAAAYCRTCGRPLCAECERTVESVIYCAEHAPVVASQPAAVAPAAPAARAGEGSPGLALLLGFIPGVGAIYNGQYAKGLVHAVIFGLLITIMNNQQAVGSLEPLFGILLTAWIFYMAIEAYHTALRRRAGEPVDEFSSLVNLHGGSFPVGAVTLILLGMLLLMNTLGYLDFRYIARYWPVVLIVAGLYMLYLRLTPPRERNGERK